MEIAELSERSQIARAARSVEDINTIRVASFGSRSVRLTKVARLRKDCHVWVARRGMHFEQKVTKATKGGRALVAIRNGATEEWPDFGTEYENTFHHGGHGDH